MKFTIGNREFASKREATEAIRKVLYAYGIGERVTDDEHCEFLSDILAMHPEDTAKIGCGVSHFSVESNGPTRGFWLTRTDGTRTDFSVFACLTPPSRRSNALAAMRLAVAPSIRRFRESCGATMCALTGDPLDIRTAHIDHADPTFIELAEAFAASIGSHLVNIAVAPTTDGSTKTELADDGVRAAWVKYHDERATLRAVLPLANLSRKRGGR